MEKILDLNELLNRRHKIKLNNRVLSVRDVNICQFEKMLKIEESNDSEEQLSLLAELLSNNDEKEIISIEDIKKLTRPVVICLWQFFVTESINIATNPN